VVAQTIGTMCLWWYFRAEGRIEELVEYERGLELTENVVEPEDNARERQVAVEASRLPPEYEVVDVQGDDEGYSDCCMNLPETILRKTVPAFQRRVRGQRGYARNDDGVGGTLTPRLTTFRFSRGPISASLGKYPNGRQTGSCLELDDRCHGRSIAAALSIKFSI
jgi:hypothetical protein